METKLWEVLLGLALVFVAPAAIAGGLGFWLSRSLRGWRFLATILACGLVFPLLSAVYVSFEFATRSIIGSIDDTAADVDQMYMADFYWAVVLTPLCLGSAIAGAFLRRARSSR